jgi:large subunit ribosomal protein L21
LQPNFDEYNKKEVMYAIVDIAGQQFKVEKDQELFVHRLSEEKGAKIDFDNVMLVDNDGDVKVGKPNVGGAKVSAEVLEHTRGNKVKIFKKKRRKGFQKETGYRDDLTKVKIADITA